MPLEFNFNTWIISCNVIDNLKHKCTFVRTNIQNIVLIKVPTILNLVGCSSPATHVVDGQLLDTLLTGKRDVTRRESFLMHYPHSPHRSDYFTSYRDGAWKVIYHYIPSKAWDGSHYQLFNLVEDPFEQIDLADSNPVELKRMMQGLAESLAQHNALYPVESDTKLAMKPKVPG